jgi:hypothetical protein
VKDHEATAEPTVTGWNCNLFSLHLNRPPQENQADDIGRRARNQGRICGEPDRHIVEGRSIQSVPAYRRLPQQEEAALVQARGHGAGLVVPPSNN